MDAAVKSNWVAALRSGNYNQGEGKLYRSANDSYCCLGVLCSLFPDCYVSNSGASYKGSTTSESGINYIPINLAEEIGLHYEDQATLASMNDGHSLPYLKIDAKTKHDFLKIADWIEENL